MSNGKNTIIKKDWTGRDTFVIDGIEYLCYPNLDELLVDAGISQIRKREQVLKVLDNEGIDDTTQLYSMSKNQLKHLLNEKLSKLIYRQVQRVKRRSNLVIDAVMLEKMEESYHYLPSGSSDVDRMLSYSNGKSGFRSRTLIELFGEPSLGKTQFCLTAACMVMRPIDMGGWAKAVAYIDSEGSFEYSRFVNLARYWGISLDFIRDNLFVSKVDSFDDVEEAINEIAKLIRSSNIGIIIVDSIMDPLRSQYPIGGEDLRNLQPRQKHLKKVTDRLKSLAQVHNLISLYTNHVRANFDNTDSVENKLIPQGGNVLAHASDIRIKLEGLDKKERVVFDNYDKLLDVGIRPAKASIVDCGFLANLSGRYLIGSFGIGDPDKKDLLLRQAKLFSQHGYICEDARGNPLKPTQKRKHVKNIQDKLYE